MLEPGVVCNVNIVRKEGLRQVSHVQSPSDFERQERGNLGIRQVRSLQQSRQEKKGAAGT